MPTTRVSKGGPSRDAGVALGYGRVSVEDKRKPGISPKTQENVCRSHPSVHGMRFEYYEDLDYSGKNTKRPAYQRLLARLAKGDVRVLTAYSLSRVSRSVADFYDLYTRQLAPRGIDFVSATEPFDTKSSFGRAMMGLLAVFAQMEREVTGERVRANFGHARTAREVGRSG